LSPTAEQVAVQAQVGLRTVFRHFDDMETLYREISVDLDAISIPLLKTRLQSATWESRLMESIELRAQIFEELTPFFLSSSLHRHLFCRWGQGAGADERLECRNDLSSRCHTPMQAAVDDPVGRGLARRGFAAWGKALWSFHGAD
jgi:AcrR family transcriptional regulator